MMRAMSDDTDTTPALPDLAAGLERLAAPFADGQIGKLPRVTCGKCRSAPGKCCADHSKARCSTCKQWMTDAHMHIDYVGHAQVTARLLEVDPCWSWEPVAWDVNGMPAIAEEQGGRRVMWIRLTVLGVTRLGVGIAGAHEEVEKILVGDALRNAAMRFGVALDLWAKGDLHAPTEDTDSPPPPPTQRRTQRSSSPPQDTPVDDPPAFDWAGLGWVDQAEHDAAWEQCKLVAKSLPDEHQANVRAWVKDEGDGPPYNRAFLDEWADMMDTLTAPAGDE